MSSDELWLNGSRIPLPEETVIALTYQANNIADMGSRQGSLSNTFTIPLTQEVRETLESSEQVNSDTDIPYQKLSARIVREGTDVKGFENAYGILEKVPTKTEAEVTAYGGNKDPFSDLEGASIRELDLDDLDHDYDLATVVAKNINTTDGITYPVIDFSNDDSSFSNLNRNVDIRNLMPCMFLHTLITRIFTGIGWTISGDILTDPHYTGIALNCVTKLAGDPTRLLAKAKMQTNFNVLLNSPATYTATLPLDEDIYDPLNVIFFTGGAMKYEARGPGDYSFQFDCQVSFVKGSSFTVRLLSNTGGTIDAATLSSTGYGSLTVSYSGLTMAAGDTVWIVIECVPDVNDDIWFLVYEDCLFQCTDADLDMVALGTTFPIACNLPDLKQSEIVKAFMWAFFLTPVPDNVNKVMKFVRFEKVKENIPNAKQVNEYIDASALELSYRLPSYAQENWLRYKPDDNVTDEYGDGVMTVGDATLDLNKTQFTMPFAASEDVTTLQSLSILNIGLFNSTDQFDSSCQPRIFQVFTGSITGPGITFGDGSGSSLQTTVGQAYFKRTGQSYNLDFQGSLIPNYGDTWASMIYRPRIVRVPAKLIHAFMQEFEHDVPWFISVSDGFVNINGYFYVNLISNYIPGRNTMCDLILLPNG